MAVYWLCNCPSPAPAHHITRSSWNQSGFWRDPSDSTFNSHWVPSQAARIRIWGEGVLRVSTGLKWVFFSFSYLEESAGVEPKASMVKVTLVEKCKLPRRQLFFSSPFWGCFRMTPPLRASGTYISYEGTAPPFSIPESVSTGPLQFHNFPAAFCWGSPSSADGQ